MRARISGEPAYEPGILIKFPTYLWYDSIHPECQYTSEEGQIRCTFANKVDGGETIVKSFSFMCREDSAKFEKREPLRPNFEFMFVTTSNLTDDSSVSRNATVTIYKEADLRLSGASSPATVIYGGQIRGAYSIKKGGDLRSIGQQLIHSYEVYNYGLSDIPTLDLEILWPETLNNGKYLFYVTQEPQVTDSLDNRYPITKYLCSGSNFEVDPFEIGGESSSGRNSKGRKRRASGSDPPPSEQYITSQASEMVIDCFNKKAQCSKYSCTFNDIKSKTGVKVAIRSRIWNSTFAEDLPSTVDVYSHAYTKIVSSNYLHQEEIQNDLSSVRTRVVKDPKLLKHRQIPIWIIILAVVGGLLLLLIVILICAKLGFFRRKRQVNRANNYRPPPQHTFQLGEIEDFDYRNHLEAEPAAPRTTYITTTNVALGNDDNGGTGGSDKKRSKKDKRGRNYGRNQEMTEPYTGGYWGDVSHT